MQERAARLFEAYASLASPLLGADIRTGTWGDLTEAQRQAWRSLVSSIEYEHDKESHTVDVAEALIVAAATEIPVLVAFSKLLMALTTDRLEGEDKAFEDALRKHIGQHPLVITDVNLRTTMAPDGHYCTVVTDRTPTEQVPSTFNRTTAVIFSDALLEELLHARDVMLTQQSTDYVCNTCGERIKRNIDVTHGEVLITFSCTLHGKLSPRSFRRMGE